MNNKYNLKNGNYIEFIKSFNYQIDYNKFEELIIYIINLLDIYHNIKYCKLQINKNDLYVKKNKNYKYNLLLQSIIDNSKKYNIFNTITSKFNNLNIFIPTLITFIINYILFRSCFIIIFLFILIAIFFR